MDQTATLPDRFEAHRAHLHAVAYRMLGSAGEADDAVQEAWLRLSRSDAGAVDNLGGWLTTVVARICLDVLRARKSRREEPLAPDAGAAGAGGEGLRPDAELQLADSIGVALLVVLETLAPAERIAFVLHDMFDVPFDDIAPIVGRNPTATRQLASRARRRVQGASPGADAHPSRQRRVVDAFLAASRNGDFAALLAALDPDVVLRADPLAVETAAAHAAQGAPVLMPEVRGARAVAGGFSGRARGARPALVGGLPGAVWAPGGVVQAAFAFSLANGKIVAIDIIMDPTRLRTLDPVVYDARQP
jgi:RNA polymerase sigma-70 factor (ECF subfamily)